MLKALVRTRFASLFSRMFRSSKGGQKMSIGKKILFGILWIYVAGIFLFLFGAIFSGMSQMLATEFNWFYFAFAGLAAFFFCFIGSVFITQSQLFEATDNELLLSMPIPPRYILLSRLLMLLILNYFYEALVFLPAAVIYAISGFCTVSGMLLLFVSYLLMPLLTMTISCLFGWLLALISSHLRRKNFVQVFLMIVFLGVYFYFCGNMQNYLAALLQNGTQIAEAVRQVIPPIYFMGDAIANGNLLSFLWFALFCLIPMILVYWLLSHFFIRIATSNRGIRKVAYRRRELRVSSPLRALVWKEFRYFTSLPMYMMNSAMGVILCILIPVLILLQRDAFAPFLAIMGSSAQDAAGALAALMICFCASVNIITAPSISLEGIRLWIVRSLPVPSRDILISKVLVHCMVCIPPLIVSALLSSIFLGSSILGIVCAVLLPCVVTVLVGLLGIVINLHMPKFDWLNETVCVKQSASTMLTMFGSMGLILVPVLLYIMLGSSISLTLYMLICLAVFALGCVGLYFYLVRRGTVLFENLQN